MAAEVPGRDTVYAVLSSEVLEHQLFLVCLLGNLITVLLQYKTHIGIAIQVSVIPSHVLNFILLIFKITNANFFTTIV